jgi:hypothetical protein
MGNVSLDPVQEDTLNQRVLQEKEKGMEMGASSSAIGLGYDQGESSKGDLHKKVG